MSPPVSKMRRSVLRGHFWLRVSRRSASGVGTNAIVILWASSQSRSRSAELRVSSSTRWTLAPGCEIGPELPDSRVEAQARYMAGPVAAVTENACLCQDTRLARPPWVISTPLGLPVEPEV